MPFKDYSTTPGENTTLGETIYVGPNMARDDTRPAIQQLMADGKELADALLPSGIRNSKFLAFDAAGKAIALSGAPSAGVDLDELGDESGAALIGVEGGGSLADLLDGLCLPETFGIVDDANYLNPTTRIDQAAKLQEWFDYAAANRLTPYCARSLRVYAGASLTIDLGWPAAATKTGDIRLKNLVLSSQSIPAVTIGSDANTVVSALIEPPSVYYRSASSFWNWTGLPNTKCGALVMINFRHCEVHLPDVRGYPVGWQHWASGTGFHGWYAYNSFIGGLAQDCRFAEVLTCVGADSFLNENVWLGGAVQWTSTTGAASVTSVTGVYFTQNAGYAGHNNNRWYGRSFEMTDPQVGGHPNITESVPVWFEGCGNNNRFKDCRVEYFRGPIMHVRGNINSDTNAVYGLYNELDVSLLYSGPSGQGIPYVRQVAGAFGNLVTAPQSTGRMEWHSGNLRDKLFTDGTMPKVLAPFYVKDHNSGTPKRALTTDATYAATNIYGQQWALGGVFIMLDTSVVKDFEFHADVHKDFPGRWFFRAYDADMNALGATSTDSYATERNVKFAGAAASGNFGGGWSNSEDGAKGMRVTLRDEVKFLEVGKVSGTNAQILGSFGFTAFFRLTTASGNEFVQGPLIYDPVVGAFGDVRIAAAKPDTAGAHGFWSQGMVAGNSAAASGQPSGWVCNGGVALGRAYGNSLALTVPGQVIIANGNAYRVKTAGTTAGAGSGPSGTSPTTDYTDGTAVFRYLGAKASFAVLANVA